MSKNPSQTDDETMQDLDFLKKLKRSKHFEPSLGVIGFFFISFCVICVFFYSDYSTAAKGYLVAGQSERFMGLKFNRSGDNYERFDFLGEKGDGCDVFDGDWVWDEKYPLYQSKDCRFLDEGFRCAENGRPDMFYTKWKWQPKHCNLPRFDPKTMLEKLRNKRLVFVGDSIGRNQWESLLCMLSSAVDKDSIYEVNGSPITKHKGFLVFMFKDFNCTVEYYRAPFLVLQSRPPAGAPEKIKMTIKLDQMDWNAMKWRDANVLVFNTGHWWNYEKTIRGGCYFQEGDEVKLKMKVEDAYKRSMETVLNWTQSEVNMSNTRIFFRTIAPVHFRGGDWKTGGSCHMEKLPELGSSLVPFDTWTQFKIASDVISAHSNPSEQKTFDVLNVTQMTARRNDGHSSLYYLSPKEGPASLRLRRQDCSHWCLPGVPDSWNELFYALYLKRDAYWTLNSSRNTPQV